MSQDIAAPNRFKFFIEDFSFANRPFELSVVGVNVPGVNLGIIEQPTSIIPIPIPGDSLIFNDLTIEFILDESLEAWLEIFRWIQSIRSTSQISEQKLYYDATLMITTNKFNKELNIKFSNCFPYSLGDIQYNTNVDTTEVIMSTVSFKFLEMVIE